jgi:hypothetical protein
MKRIFLCGLVVTGVSVGCGGNSQSTTAPSTTTTSPTTELFAGALGPRASSFYSFTLAQAGTVTITLASVSVGSRGAAVPSVVGLGLGVPHALGCSLTSSTNTGAGLSAQMISEETAGIHCVAIDDIGNLADTLNFVIRIVHP